jgi:rhodanese-related sulfurtransferase
MTPQELQELLIDDARAEGVQFVDVREQAEHDIARLPRFQLYPLSQAARCARS